MSEKIVQTAGREQLGGIQNGKGSLGITKRHLHSMCRCLFTRDTKGDLI